MPLVNKTCKQCHKSYLVKPYRKNVAKFCSYSCYWKNHLGTRENGGWKGDKVGYSGIHIWLIQSFGRATICEQCKVVGEKINGKWNIEWAKLKGKPYKRNRENFWRLCHKCHSHYDKVGFKRNYTPWNKGLNYKHRKKG